MTTSTDPASVRPSRTRAERSGAVGTTERRSAPLPARPGVPAEACAARSTTPDLIASRPPRAVAAGEPGAPEAPVSKAPKSEVPESADRDSEASDSERPLASRVVSALATTPAGPARNALTRKPAAPSRGTFFNDISVFFRWNSRNSVLAPQQQLRRETSGIFCRTNAPQRRGNSRRHERPSTPIKSRP